MADYIVQKPVDITKLTTKALKAIEGKTFDITPKYDGCCAVLCFDFVGRFYGAFSATGEPVLSMDHIGQHLAAKWEYPPLRGIALIGEAWMPNTEFPVINGTFRRQSVQPELRFVPFDAVRWMPTAACVPNLADQRPYNDRVWAVLLRGYDDRFVLPLVHYSGDLASAEGIAKSWKAKGGYDGAIIRDPYAPYVVGRSKQEVIKVKPVLSLDLLVTGWKVEPGEKTGRPVPSLRVTYQGVESWVGSGIPHASIEEDPTGLIAEVECMGLTPDGKLREPRFKGIRYDKAGAD